MKRGVSLVLLGDSKIIVKKIASLFIWFGLACGTAFAISTPTTNSITTSNNSNVKKNKLHKNHKNKKKPKKSEPRNYMRGLASYYGGEDNFEGRQMANGDVFDSSNINVCAHPTLPLGTKLKVTNVVNGRSIYVEVTDRMPRGNKVIDLSKSGARALGMHHRGVGRVTLTKVSESEFEHNYNNLEVEEHDNGAPH